MTAEAELCRLCKSGAGDKGRVVDIITKLTRGGAPCQYLEFATAAAAATAQEHLSRVLPKEVYVRYRLDCTPKFIPLLVLESASPFPYTSLLRDRERRWFLLKISFRSEQVGHLPVNGSLG